MTAPAYRNIRTVRGGGNPTENDAIPANLGLGVPDNPYKFNYLLGDTIQALTFTSAGPITVELAGTVSEIFENDCGIDELRRICRDSGLCDYVCVGLDATGGAGHEVYIIRFSGIRSGKCVPLLKVRNPVYPASEPSPPTPGTATVTMVQEGGTDAGAIVHLLPTNLPQAIGLIVRRRDDMPAAGLSGTYDYAICYRSEILRRLGKPSVVSEQIASDGKGIEIGFAIPNTLWFDGSMGEDVAGGHIRRLINRAWLFRRKVGSARKRNELFTFGTPTADVTFTLEFPEKPGFPTGTIIGKADGTGDSAAQVQAAFATAGIGATVRKLTGIHSGYDLWEVEITSKAATNYSIPTVTASSGSAANVTFNEAYVTPPQDGGFGGDPDGFGASNGWYKVAEFDIDPTRIGQFQYFVDTLSDSKFVSDERLPVENDYPPRDAQFVVMHDGRAVYAPSRPGNSRIYFSRTPMVGGSVDGEQGVDYVSPTAYDEMARYLATDNANSGLLSSDGALLISFDDRLIEGVLATRPGETNRYRVLKGVRGFASHWVVAELEELADVRPSAVWLGSNGRLYQYGQGTASLFTRRLRRTARTLIRKFWNRLRYFDPADNWHFANVVVDSDEDRLIFNCILDDTDYPRLQIVVDMARGEITFWNIQAGCFWLERRTDPLLGQRGAEAITFAVGAQVRQLAAGKGDAGSGIDWWYEFGDLALGGPFQGMRLRSVALEFDLRDFGGAMPSLTVAATLDSGVSPVLAVDNAVLAERMGRLYGLIDAPAKRCRLKVSGVQLDDTTHGELVAVQYEVSPEGPRNREGD